MHFSFKGIINYGDCIKYKEKQAIARPTRPQVRGQKGPAVGTQIRATEVRVINEKGDMLGVMPTSRAIEIAGNVGLDLMEVSPDGKPPVCKILDAGRYKYEQQKKANLARKRQKTSDLKEIKLRPGIENHDFGVKLKAARKFIEQGHKVKISLRFRGREITHQDLGRDVVKRMIAEMLDIAKLEQEPKLESRQILALLIPDTANKT